MEEKTEIKSEKKVMKGESKTIRCNHCFSKFTYEYDDIKHTKDSHYGMMDTVRCSKCNRLVTIH